MNVRRHKLVLDNGERARFERTPNMGEAMEPRFLVMHYTAGPALESSVRWLRRREARASAHLVIGRDGSVVQLAPFDRIAWHAGVSRWNGIEGLNRCSIGIELDNAGRLKREGGGEWRSWFGRTYPEDEVMVAPHKHEVEDSGWHTFTPEQIEAALETAATLVSRYGLEDVLGHDDISPGRKVDPGPAFPMGSFRARLLGRDDRAPTVLETSVDLNIRSGPGTEFERLEGSPLPQRTAVEVIDDSADWKFVDVLEGPEDVPDLQGWVHGRYLRKREQDGDPGVRPGTSE